MRWHPGRQGCPQEVVTDRVAMDKRVFDKILVANDLRSGDVVFMGPSGWTQDYAGARIVCDPEEDAALDGLARSEMAKNIVVDAYLVEIERDELGRPEPVHYREKMRIKGPSIRLDLGKQAIRHAPMIGDLR
jgi:hypothetical protein